uniref:primase-helicase family protein n=1 Tax=Flavobacterium sp. TaxID=239 RepID=UPI0037BF7E93
LSKSFKYFNSYHSFFYQSASIYKIYNTTIDTYTNFDKSFDDLTIRDKEDKFVTKFSKLYNECQHKMKYSKFCFEPNKKDKDDEYNLFTGFKYDSDNNDYDINDINIYLEHIKYLTNNDEAATNYIINWISHIIQKPEQKTRVCIVFYSQTEQVGKNLLLDILSELFNGYTNKIKDTNALIDRFNGDMMGKLFVVGDEINARAQDICNELKDIITRETEIIEFKNKDKINVNDYKNYVMTTNNENVFKISNSDKRFVFVECPDVRKDEDYYNRLLQFKKDKTKLKQLYNYFKTKDISTFQPIKIVVTEYKKHLILNNLPAYFRFIKDEYDLLNNDENIPIDILYKMSIEYARKNRLQSTYTDRLFSQQMHKILGEFKIMINRKVHYKFPSDNGLKGDKRLDGIDYIKQIFEQKLI